MMWFHDMSWGAWVVMSFAMVAFWALVVWLVVAFGRDNGPHKTAPKTELPTASAGRILAERYARGDIDADDYHRLLDDLRGGQLSGSRS